MTGEASSAVIEVRAIPWGLRPRVMEPRKLRSAADNIAYIGGDSLTGVVVTLAVWLAIVIGAPVIVLVLAGLVFAVEAPILVGVGLLYVLARFAGLMPWTVVVTDLVSGTERRSSTRNIVTAVRRVRTINQDGRVPVRWKWA